MSWDYPLTVESSRGTGGSDDPDNLLGGPAGATTTLSPPIGTAPNLSHDASWGEAEWADEPAEKDGTPPPAQPELAHQSRTSVIEEAMAYLHHSELHGPYTVGPFDELEHPRGLGGKFAVKGVKDATVDHYQTLGVERYARGPAHPPMWTGSAGMLASKHFHGDSLSLHAPNGQLSAEREALHRQIIAKALRGSKKQEHPQALFTAGGAASGKSSLVDQLAVPKGHVYVNPDTIKEQLPEYHMLKESGHADIAAAKMHEESSQLAAQISKAAMQSKRSVVIDGVGDSQSRKFVGKLESAQRHGHEVTVRYAHVPLATALEREQARRERTGRAVPHDVLRHAHMEVAARYHDEVQHLRGVKVEVYDTNRPNRGAPVMIHHIRPSGETETPDVAKYREFLSKRHPGATAVVEAFDEDLHPRDLHGRWFHGSDNPKLPLRGREAFFTTHQPEAHDYGEHVGEFRLAPRNPLLVPHDQSVPAALQARGVPFEAEGGYLSRRTVDAIRALGHDALIKDYPADMRDPSDPKPARSIARVFDPSAATRVQP